MKPVRIPFVIESVANIVTVFESVWMQLQKKFPDLNLSRQTHVDVKTAFYEAVMNAAKHARELEKKGFISGVLFLDTKAIGFEVLDHGPGFAIEKVPIPDLAKMKASGRGVFIMNQVGDDVRYRRGKSGNVLRFKRYLVGQDSSSREIDLIYQLSEAVIRGVGLDEVCRMILDRALEIFHVERASILIYDEKIKRLKVVASRGLSGDVRKSTLMRAGEGVSGYVFQHGRPLLIEDIDSNVRGIEKKSGYKSRSFISAPMICSPLRLDERPFGVINLTDRIDGKKFTKKDLKILSTIANQAMSCLYISDLMKEAKRGEELKHELEMVSRIQTYYLPKQAPQVQGFDIAGSCEMAQSVGGDYFDYFLVHGWLYLVVADVSGHDIKSAMTMFNFRSQLRVLMSQQMAPDNILTHMNFTMHEDLVHSGHFVSVVIMRIDAATGEYVIASAGHYPPLFSDGRFEPVDSGMVLGIEKRESYRSHYGRLVAGQSFLLFTDGLVEAMDGKGKFYGIDRLKKKFRDTCALPSAKIVSTLVEDTLSFRSAKSVLDDITAVVLKYE